jgi:hypothetical protein
MVIKFIIGGLGLSGKMFPRGFLLGLIEESSFSNQPWLYARWNWEQISLRTEMQGGHDVHLRKHPGCLFG